MCELTQASGLCSSIWPIRIRKVANRDETWTTAIERSVAGLPIIACANNELGRIICRNGATANATCAVF